MTRDASSTATGRSGSSAASGVRGVAGTSIVLVIAAGDRDLWGASSKNFDMRFLDVERGRGHESFRSRPGAAERALSTPEQQIDIEGLSCASSTMMVS